jgi:hypothetical protein
LGKGQLCTRFYSKIYIRVYLPSNCTEESLAPDIISEELMNVILMNNTLRKNYQNKVLDTESSSIESMNYRGSEFMRGNSRTMMQIKKGRMDSDSTEEPLEQIVDISNPIGQAHGHGVTCLTEQ